MMVVIFQRLLSVWTTR